MVAIPLDVSGIGVPIDRIGMEHVSLYRGRKRLALSGASIEVGSDGSHTLLVPRRVTGPRSAYSVLVGAAEELQSDGKRLREVVTLVWRSPLPSPQLVAAIRDVLQRGRAALLSGQSRQS